MIPASLMSKMASDEAARERSEARLRVAAMAMQALVQRQPISKTGQARILYAGEARSICKAAVMFADDLLAELASGMLAELPSGD